MINLRTIIKYVSLATITVANYTSIVKAQNESQTHPAVLEGEIIKEVRKKTVVGGVSLKESFLPSGTKIRILKLINKEKDTYLVKQMETSGAETFEVASDNITNVKEELPLDKITSQQTASFEDIGSNSSYTTKQVINNNKPPHSVRFSTGKLPTPNPTTNLAPSKLSSSENEQTEEQQQEWKSLNNKKGIKSITKVAEGWKVKLSPGWYYPINTKKAVGFTCNSQQQIIKAIKNIKYDTSGLLELESLDGTMDRLNSIHKRETQEFDETRNQVSLKKDMETLKILPRKQESNPEATCILYSTITELEYQLAKQGSPKKLSIPFLGWAHDQLGGKREAIETSASTDRKKTLIIPRTDVYSILALKKYGICEETLMPLSKLGTDPSDDALENASNLKNWKTEICFIKTEDNGDNKDYKLIKENRDKLIKDELLKGNPVIIGMNIPKNEKGYIFKKTEAASDQKNADGKEKEKETEAIGHSVLVTGFKINPEDNTTTYEFLNSWGREWGKDGYGFVTSNYLDDNLQSAYTIIPKTEQELTQEKTQDQASIEDDKKIISDVSTTSPSKTTTQNKGVEDFLRNNSAP